MLDVTITVGGYGYFNVTCPNSQAIIFTLLEIATICVNGFIEQGNS
jgi:hypothetical protein